MREIWKKVKYKHFTHYKISNLGRLKNSKFNRIIKGHKIPSLTRGNFVLFALSNQYRHRSILAHLLVFDHFKVHELKGRAVIWHKDWNGLNNKDSNLNEITWGDLKRRAFELKNFKRGVYKWSAKGKQDRFRATLKVNNEVITLGYTKRKKDAEILYEFGYNLIYGSNPY